MCCGCIEVFRHFYVPIPVWWNKHAAVSVVTIIKFAAVVVAIAAIIVT